MRRDTRSAYRRRAAETERQVDAAVAAVKAERDAAYAAARDAAREAEANRIQFTAADLADACAVRDRFGWHPVVRVNKKTVTVGTGYSFTRSVPVEKVLEYRNPEPSRAGGSDG